MVHFASQESWYPAHGRSDTNESATMKDPRYTVAQIKCVVNKILTHHCLVPNSNKRKLSYFRNIYLFGQLFSINMTWYHIMRQILRLWCFIRKYLNPCFCQWPCPYRYICHLYECICLPLCRIICIYVCIYAHVSVCVFASYDIDSTSFLLLYPYVWVCGRAIIRLLFNWNISYIKLWDDVFLPGDFGSGLYIQFIDMHVYVPWTIVIEISLF